MADTTSSRWQQRVARWQASGETAEAFSAREGCAASTLRWWASKLRRQKPERPTVGMLQLVRVPSVASQPQPANGSAIIVELLEARARVTIEPGVDAATLATVFAALGVRGAA